MIEYEYCPRCGDAVYHPVSLFQRCPRCKGALSPVGDRGLLSIHDRQAPPDLSVEVSEEIPTADRVGGAP